MFIVEYFLCTFIKGYGVLRADNPAWSATVNTDWFDNWNNL